MTKARRARHEVVEKWLAVELGPERMMTAEDIRRGLPLLEEWGAMTKLEVRIALWMIGEVDR